MPPRAAILRKAQQSGGGTATGAGTDASFQQKQQMAQNFPPTITPQQAMAFRQQQAMMQQQAAQRQSHVNLGRTNRTRDRYENVLTKKEVEEQTEREENSRSSFRYFFAIFIFIVIALLMLQKRHVELMEVPDINGEKKMLTAEGTPDPTVIQSNEEDAKEQEHFYNLLNVKTRIQKPKARADEPVEGELDADAKKRREQEDLERRRANYAARKELKKAYESHQEDYGQLVHCGRACENDHKQVEVAYQTLAGQVDRELFGVLLDENVHKTGRRTASHKELKEAYEKKKAVIEKQEVDAEHPEDKNMALEELKDAYDILSHHEAKAYYTLYGRKPPEFMKHVSNKDGGWGQKLLLKTHKNEMILAWLDYLASATADYWVLGVILAIGFILPAVMQAGKIWELANQITNNMEEMDQWEREARQQEAAAAK